MRLKWLSILLVVMWSILPGAVQAKRPNVVLILIDDLNHYGVTAYGANRISEWSGAFTNRVFSTPRIDLLADEGLRCDNAYVYPLCEPTRIALMSGQFNSRNFLKCKSQHASEITFGDVFQQAGYATGIFGKWKQTRGTREIHAKDYIYEFGWDEFCCFDVVGERQRYINPNLVMNGKQINYEGRSDLDPATGRRWYGPDICNQRALDFIDRHKNDPFFLYYPMLLVHDEHKPTPDTQPRSLFDECDEAKANDDRRYFPDMLAYMDKLIGKVVDKLDEHGLRDNTLVLVMGDNGTKEPFTHVLPDGTEYSGGKGGNKDNGLHVPLILSCPGTISAGKAGAMRSYQGLVDVTDIYPTLCQAAGITIPNPNAIDGVSFWPQVLGGFDEARQVIYTWYNGNNPVTDQSKTLRYAFTKDFKRYAPHANFPDGRFFDLRSDPMENAGDQRVKVAWVHTHSSGLDIKKLTGEQRIAYEQLGKVLAAHDHVPVTGLKIEAPQAKLTVGTAVNLHYEVSPAQATRQNIVWESSHPGVASVDKFGVLTGHAPGKARISVYSWDDATPLATKAPVAYARDGLRDSIEIVVTDGNTEGIWEQLRRQVETRRIELAALISKAEQEGITTDYAEVSLHVIATFLKAAQHDHDHMDRVRDIFKTFGYYRKIDPVHTDRLPVTELEACIDVADFALAELRQQMDGAVTLSPAPDFSRGDMLLKDAYYQLDGRTVFPSSLVWMPKEEGHMEAFGRLGEAYYQLGHLKTDGTLSNNVLKRAVDSLEQQCELNAAPLVFFMGHAPAGWMKDQHIEILRGARHFTQYDIDSPFIRDWIKALCKQMLPGVSRSGANRPQVHLLANEPHFATAKGGWRASNGLSEFSMQKYRKWIAAKYKTVQAVNDTYGSAYASLDQVTVDLPIDPALRGSTIWYDWCRFNMDRVNNWFTFLKQQVQANDHNQAPVTIKMLGFTLSTPQRDHGLDIEYLTKLQDIPGADLRVAPRDAVFYGKQEVGLDPETGWVSRYAYDWVEQSMYLDFTKSICPDKLFYDSEWHGFGAVSWRHFKMDRDYVRSALWMAFTHGMGAIKPWLWGRGADGALRSSADHIGELATQPIAVDAYGRVMKELNAHAEHVVLAVPSLRQFMIYYCEEAAIQDRSYTEDFKTTYEALKLLNLQVGFTTPSEIARLNTKEQVLIVPPTQFIANQSLRCIRAFQQAGGRVVLVEPGRSFLKDELGMARSSSPLKAPFASLPLTSVLHMVPALDAALAPLKSSSRMTVEVTDLAGKRALGVIIHEAWDPKTGRLILVLNNVSKDPRVVHVKARNGQRIRVKDRITKTSVQSEMTLAPCDVRLLSVGG